MAKADFQAKRAKGSVPNDAQAAKGEMVDSLVKLGMRVLGSEERAREWMASPILSLQGQKPVELLDTPQGNERVRNKLLQIEYGTF